MSLELTATLSDDCVDYSCRSSQRMLLISLSATENTPPLPLNLSLVLDQSGSMAGPAIEYLKDAARYLVGQLNAQDRLSIVTFNEVADVLVPRQPATENRELLRLALGRLEASGGTAMDEGVALGLCELSKADIGDRGGSRFAQRMFVLTDGHNQNGDDRRCVALAQGAVAEHVTIAAFGMGETFNVKVLGDLANAGNGMLHHITSPTMIEPAFKNELQSIQRIVAARMRLHLELAAGTKLGEKDPVCLVAPAVVIQEVKAEPNGYSVPLGDLSLASPLALLVTVYLEGPAAGDRPIGKIYATYDSADAAENRTATLELSARWINGYVQAINPLVNQAMTRMAIFKQRQKAMALAQTDPSRATTILQNATELAGESGNQELKTILQQTLLELARDGHVSNRTLIQGEVSARTVLQ